MIKALNGGSTLRDADSEGGLTHDSAKSLFLWEVERGQSATYGGELVGLNISRFKRVRNG